jgi:hypothetical protein
MGLSFGRVIFWGWVLVATGCACELGLEFVRFDSVGFSNQGVLHFLILAIQLSVFLEDVLGS